MKILKKFVYICFLLFYWFFVYIPKVTASFVSGNFSYGGAEFIVGSLSGGYSPLKKINLYSDLYYFLQGTGEMTGSKSYAVSFYTTKNVYSKNVVLNILVGIGVSQSFFDYMSSNIIFSPNIGLNGGYKFSEKYSLFCKTLFFIYSNGFSMPYYIELNYKLNERFYIIVGSLGKSDLIMGDGVILSFQLGGSVGIKYKI